MKGLTDIRNREYARWKRLRTFELYEAFKAARAAVNARIRRSKSMFYGNHFRTCIYSRRKWKEIYNLCLVNRVSDGLQEIDVDLVNRQFESNHYFHYCHFYDKIRFNQRQTHEFNFFHFRQEEVL